MLTRLFGTKNDRELKRLGKRVESINALEEQYAALDADALRGLTATFRQQVAEGRSLDDLLPEAFAAVREASRRTLGMRPFDVQLIGGMVLHEGKIAEMRTGEGKTLVATLPAYLNALTGDGVHIVTVNDYLAARDADWMRPIYEFLGLTVGVALSQQDPESKRAAYAADITYGTNNEFGFDFLRDNMAFSLEEKVQRRLAFAIVDEVDSILIDEARTPLIISGAAQDSSELYMQVNKLIPGLQPATEEVEGQPAKPGHYTLDEKSRQVEFTEMGLEEVERRLVQAGLMDQDDSLYAPANLGLLHHLHAALKAHMLFHKNVEYIVQNRQVVIVDEHTGRTMPGRRWSEGIHQAVEAKEGVPIQQETQTLASTTFQNYFRLYDKLAGMTGTADTEAFEFRQIYGLDVVVIPTHKPMIRKDYNDLVYMTMAEKFDAIIEDIRECVQAGRPVLVGTISIETSEYLSQLLKKQNIPHAVLNAKFHEKEAEIVAQAGRPGAVTIATNMAGRGTDIVLGGNWEAEIADQKEQMTEARLVQIRAEWKQRHDAVLAAGGLHIIGTERHESRRIDNQLRGRAGRQGDPGSSRFYLSLEDNLMRIFASDRMRGFMQALGMEKGEAIEHRMVSNSIEKAQRKVEGRNFDIRKQLLEYDDVANDQRTVIYQQRRELLEADDIHDVIEAVRADVVHNVINAFIAPGSLEEQWDIPGLEAQIEADFGLKLPVGEWLEKEDSLYEETLRQRILDRIVAAYQEKENQVGADVMRSIEKQIMLRVLDDTWKDHLASMDYLRQGIHLRGYAHKNPKQEYKREAFHLFQDLLETVKLETVRILSFIQVTRREDAEEVERQRRQAMAHEMHFEHAEAGPLLDEAPAGQPQPEEEGVDVTRPYVREERKVGRNEPCPCGSGKKYKHCHGRL